jgi:membrane fusion protein (multidrug efflux system)
MAETSLKVVPDAPGTTDEAPKPKRRITRKRLRMVLLVLLPLIAAAGGLALYAVSGRYITTDNAYVGAQKVLITPDISGKVHRVMVREGQHVKAGDELFEIDPQPFRIALDQAKAKLSTVRADFAVLKGNLKTFSQLVQFAKENVELKQRDVERKKALVATRSVSQADVDTAISTAVTAALQTKLAEQRRDEALHQLLNDADLPIEKFPAFIQANAVLEQAQRDFDHTILRAPIAGMATQVDNIQLGRFVTAGTPVFSIIDDSSPWVDANPKETDITNLQIGQRVMVVIDTFPDQTFYGTVESVSPGTGAQFAILPPQNASGNWVKVVQRVPLRIRLDQDPTNVKLRAGMSAYVEIDTGKRRNWFSAPEFKQAADER